jgi:sulfur-oxidizing protein SoxA
MPSRRYRPIRVCIVLALVGAVAAAEIPLAQRRSGYDDMSRETRATQDDDHSNPGMLWVLDGEALWGQKVGAAQRACSNCHGDARLSMIGVAARYPAYDERRGRPLDLAQRINFCRRDRQGSTPFAFESRDLLALTAYVARQSRGMPIEVTGDVRLKPHIDAGRELFQRRQGQLNLACAQCHDERWGQRLAGIVMPQAHPTGYPMYRLEWQDVGSLPRRLRNCMIGVRAEPYPYGAPEFVDLELYLMWRARGMNLETPGVRP